MPHEFRELGMANTSIRCADSVRKHPRVRSGEFSLWFFSCSFVFSTGDREAVEHSGRFTEDKDGFLI